MALVEGGFYQWKNLEKQFYCILATSLILNDDMVIVFFYYGISSIGYNCTTEFWVPKQQLQKSTCIVLFVLYAQSAVSIKFSSYQRDFSIKV